MSMTVSSCFLTHQHALALWLKSHGLTVLSNSNNGNNNSFYSEYFVT